MNEHFENYLKTGLYLRGWSTRTPVIYRRAFTSFQQSLRNGSVPEAHSTEGAAFTKAQLEAWTVWMRQNGRSPSGCNVYIRAMNAFCSYLVEQEILKEPIKLKQIKTSQKPVQVLSEREIRLFLASKPKKLTYLRSWSS